MERTRPLVIALVVLGSVSAHAQCTDPAAPRAIAKSIRLAARCNDRKLRLGPATTCTTSPSPACAGSLATDVLALAYGANNPPASAVDAHTLATQLRCQTKIGRSAATYVQRKMRLLQRGIDPATAEARAGGALDRVPTLCTVGVIQDASGVILPAAGPQCAAATKLGNVVGAASLRTCLQTLLGVWVDRWGPNPQPLRPNILFILSDDQRWDTTDTTHSPTSTAIMAHTRAELADSGLEFTEAFMTTPLCCPSRSSILRGSYAHRTGVYKNGGNNGGADDFDDSSTIATWLQASGYRTSLMGKYLNGYGALWDHATQPPYVPPGWTEWRGMRNVAYYNYTIVEPDGLGGYTQNFYGNTPADYSTDVLREKAKAFISASVAAGEPFFLYLAFKAPHLPQTAAPRHDGMFAGIAPWRPPNWNEADVSDKPTWMQNTPLMTAAEIADLDQVRIDQLEMLQAVDEAIGGSTTFGITGIMEHLRNLGVADNTIVVYFSDNGWHWGEHRTRAKNKPYEESIRSPMLVRYPKLVPLPRTDTTHMALNIDFAPTFAELAGVDTVPILHDGVSLLRVLDGTQPTWRTDFLTEGWAAGHVWATVRESQWKYTELPITPGSAPFEYELYDLVNDPYELQNVYSDPANAVRVATMATRLRQLRQFWPIDSDPNGPDPEEDE